MRYRKSGMDGIVEHVAGLACVDVSINAHETTCPRAYPLREKLGSSSVESPEAWKRWCLPCRAREAVAALREIVEER